MARQIVTFQGREYWLDDAGKMTLKIDPKIMNTVPIAGQSVSIVAEERGDKVRVYWHRKTDSVDGATSYIEVPKGEYDTLRVNLVTAFGAL